MLCSLQRCAAQTPSLVNKFFPPSVVILALFVPEGAAQTRVHLTPCRDLACPRLRGFAAGLRTALWLALVGYQH